jgi:hypothetical protein
MARYFIDHKTGLITEITLDDIAPAGPWQLAACEMREVQALRNDEFCLTDQGVLLRDDAGQIIDGLHIVLNRYGVGTTYGYPEENLIEFFN